MWSVLAGDMRSQAMDMALQMRGQAEGMVGDVRNETMAMAGDMRSQAAGMAGQMRGQAEAMMGDMKGVAGNMIGDTQGLVDDMKGDLNALKAQALEQFASVQQNLKVQPSFTDCITRVKDMLHELGLTDLTEWIKIDAAKMTFTFDLQGALTTIKTALPPNVLRPIETLIALITRIKNVVVKEFATVKQNLMALVKECPQHVKHALEDMKAKIQDTMSGNGDPADLAIATIAMKSNLTALMVGKEHIKCIWGILVTIKELLLGTVRH